MARYCHYCGKELKETSAQIRKHLQICFDKSLEGYKSNKFKGESPYMEKDNDRK
jgi:hypothetical protein